MWNWLSRPTNLGSVSWTWSILPTLRTRRRLQLCWGTAEHRRCISWCIHSFRHFWSLSFYKGKPAWYSFVESSSWLMHQMLSIWAGQGENSLVLSMIRRRCRNLFWSWFPRTTFHLRRKRQIWWQNVISKKWLQRCVHHCSSGKRAHCFIYLFTPIQSLYGRFSMARKENGDVTFPTSVISNYLLSSSCLVWCLHPLTLNTKQQAVQCFATQEPLLIRDT